MPDTIGGAFIKVAADSGDFDPALQRQLDGAAERAGRAMTNRMDMAGKKMVDSVSASADRAGAALVNSLGRSGEAASARLHTAITRAGDRASTALVQKMDSAGTSVGTAVGRGAEVASNALRRMGQTAVAPVTAVRQAARVGGTAVGQSFTQASKVAGDALRGLQRGAGVDFAAIANKARSSAASVGSSFKAAGSAASKGLSSTSGALGSIGSQAASFAKVGAVGLGALTAATAGFGVKSAASLETTQTAYSSLLGSQQAAQKQLADLQQFAAQTPFEFQDVAKFGQQFLAIHDSVGLAQDQLKPFLTTVGNLAAVTGASSDDVANVNRAIGQIGSTGKLTLDNLNQISEAFPGFNSVAAIASQTGKSTADVMKEISAGTLDAATYVPILIKGMQQFPGAAGAMGKQAQTLTGLISTFKDTASLALTTALQPAIPIIKNTLNQVTPIIGQATQQLGPALARGVQAIAPIIGPAIAGLGQILTTFVDTIGPAIGNLAPLFAPLAQAISGIIGVAGPLLTVFTNIVAQIGPPILSAISKLAGALGNVALNILDAFGPILPIITKLIGQLAPIFAGLLADLDPVIGVIGGALTTVLEALAPVIPPIVKVMAELAKIIGGALAQVLPVLASAFATLLAAVAPLIEAIGDGLVTVMKALAPSLPTIAQALAQLAVAASQILVAITPLIPIIAQLLAFIIKIGAGVLATVIKLFADLATTVAKIAVPAFKVLLTVFLGVVAGILHGAAAAFGWVPGVGGKLKHARDAFDKFRDGVNKSLDGVKTPKNVTVQGHDNTPPAARSANNTLNGIKDKQVAIRADLNQGSVNGVQAVLDNLTKPRTVPVTPSYPGGSRVPGVPDPRSSGNGRAYGGWVYGSGGPTSDNQTMKLSPGEFVTNAYASAVFGPQLEAMNRAFTPPGARSFGNRRAAGGYVSSVGRTAGGTAGTVDLTFTVRSKKGGVVSAAIDDINANKSLAGRAGRDLSAAISKGFSLRGATIQVAQYVRSLDAARNKLSDLKSQRTDLVNSTRDAVLGQFDVTKAGQDEGGFVRDFNSVYQSFAGATQTDQRFAGQIAKLRGLGLDSNLLAQYAQGGPSSTVDALVAGGTKSNVAALNRQFKAQQSAASQIGANVGNATFGKAISDQTHLVSTLTTDLRRSQATVTTLTKSVTALTKSVSTLTGRPVTLTLDGRVVARSTAGANAKAGRRG